MRTTENPSPTPPRGGEGLPTNSPTPCDRFWLPLSASGRGRGGRGWAVTFAIALAFPCIARAADRYPARTLAAAPSLGAGTPARPGPKPFGPRFDLFVRGLPGEDRPFADRLRPPFVRPAVSVPDTLELVFLANTRPVRVRLTVRQNGKTLEAAWDDHLRLLFDGFDRDRDGFLNRYEVDGVFAQKAVFGLFGGNFVYPNPVGAAYLEDLDKDADGRLSFAEFAAYYDPAADDLFFPRPVPVTDAADEPLTKALFAKLDRNGDGKLSKDEMRRAEELLPVLDIDEDECLNANEVLGNRPAGRPTRAVAAAPTPTAAPPPPAASPAAPLLLVNRGPVPADAVARVVEKYDRNADKALTREEVGLPADRFTSLDQDRDGKLSAAELEAWRTGPPDVLATADLAADVSRCRVDLTPTGAGWPAGLEPRAVVGRAVLRVGTQAIDIGGSALTGGPGPEPRSGEGNELFFPRNKPVVTEKDLAGYEFQYLRVVFEAADFNGDGRLTRAEWDRYIGLQTKTMNLPLAAAHAVRTPNLFQLLDDNNDGRLSVRELRTAYDRLIVLEPGGGSVVTPAALQPSAGVRVGRARAIVGGNVFRGPYGRIAADRPAAPVWFQKMDRNADRDVSRNEFLGPKAAFDKLDADGDGLISVEEAVKK